MAMTIEECLRQCLPHLEAYASMLKRKQNQPSLEAEVRECFEQAQQVLMNLAPINIRSDVNSTQLTTSGTPRV